MYKTINLFFYIIVGLLILSAIHLISDGIVLVYYGNRSLGPYNIIGGLICLYIHNRSLKKLLKK
jgi:hypothetical protein